MRVEPVTEAEAQAAGLWKLGLYDFEVTKAVESRSKAGNEMIELVVKIYDTNDKSRIVYDYLVSSPGMAYKLRHFAAATGLLPQYERGELRAIDCEGRTGRCQVGIEKGKQGYPDKQRISDYQPLVGSGAAPQAPQAPLAPQHRDVDDEIPF